jgi:hypothetical protein
MDREQKDNKHKPAVPNVVDVNEPPPPAEEEVPAAEAGTTIFREIFRNALNTARREHKPLPGRKELSRDKSRSLLLLASVVVILLLVFFGIFSSPRRTSLPSEKRARPNLGRRMTPGQEGMGQGKSATPLMDANEQSGESAQGYQVTAEDVRRTSRSQDGSMPQPVATNQPQKPSPEQYALKTVDFSAAPPPPPPENTDLKKSSIVFVRSTQGGSMAPNAQSAVVEQNTLMSLLPAGTRLVARLESPVSSAVAAPVVAVVEYNYERDGEIVVPAGAKALGKLVQTSPSGYVGLQFERLEMPDGTTEKIDATAMELHYGPLKGFVTGKRRAAKFLVNSLTGVGTVAAYMVGHQGTGFDGPLSENALLRERVAENVANAGQGELNQLSFNQNIVVTIPGNTRFYLVLQKGGSDTGTGAGVRSTGTVAGMGSVPTLEELRELMQLRRELNEMYYQQTNVQSPVARAPQP